ncbi:MAG: DegV family protein [Halanaerobiales bacterium]|nr:DegV family protein [Halanaerobiales bacterium]
MNIGLVTDSTCDLKKDLINKIDVTVIPLTVHFGAEKYIDGVDINSSTFFKNISEKEIIPKTSKPSTHTFLKKYKSMLDNNYDKIISIHVSKGLSGTYESAVLAADKLRQDKVSVIDSSSISLGLGFQVMLAAQLIKRNMKFEDIVKHIQNAKKNVSCIFTVKDLRYMKKGGRIGKAQAFLGNIFNISPIIEISPKTGKVNPLDKVRGSNKTLKRMSKLIIEKINSNDKAWIGVTHGNRDESASKLIEITKRNLPGKIDMKFYKNRISPTLGCHVGPSVYAFSTFTDELINN